MPEFIYVQQRQVQEVPLGYWVITLARKADPEGIFHPLPVILDILDGHWQHQQAMQCAARWSREFNLPIWGKSYDK